MLSFSQRMLSLPDRAIAVSTVSRKGALVGLALDLDRPSALAHFRAQGFDPIAEHDDSLPSFEAELARYALGESIEWKTPIRFEGGTPFQREIWEAIDQIPHGASISYAALAAKVGSPLGARAAGGACGRNPIPLRVPCHRVLAQGNAIGGFTGELATKRALLRHEGVAPFADGPLFSRG